MLQWRIPELDAGEGKLREASSSYECFADSERELKVVKLSRTFDRVMELGRQNWSLTATKKALR